MADFQMKSSVFTESRWPSYRQDVSVASTGLHQIGLSARAGPHPLGRPAEVICCRRGFVLCRESARSKVRTGEILDMNSMEQVCAHWTFLKFTFPLQQTELLTILSRILAPSHSSRFGFDTLMYEDSKRSYAGFAPGFIGEFL